MNKQPLISGLFLLSLLACGPGGGLVTSGSESHGLSNRLLFSAWNRVHPSDLGNEFFHLLIVVPSLENSRSMETTAWGGSADLMTFEVSFQPLGESSDPARTMSAIKFELELVELATIRTAGQEFDLLDGNLVVCVLSETGEAQVTQLSERVVDKLGVSELLRIFQDELGPDHPAQTTSVKH